MTYTVHATHDDPSMSLCGSEICDDATSAETLRGLLVALGYKVSVTGRRS